MTIMPSPQMCFRLSPYFSMPIASSHVSAFVISPLLFYHRVTCTNTLCNVYQPFSLIVTTSQSLYQTIICVFLLPPPVSFWQLDCLAAGRSCYQILLLASNIVSTRRWTQHLVWFPIRIDTMSVMPLSVGRGEKQRWRWKKRQIPSQPIHVSIQNVQMMSFLVNE